MEIRKYGLRLQRLNRDHIEMVRVWRNSEYVKSFMFFKEHITIEMQKRWFESISEDRDYYFIIYEDEYPVGLTEIKNIKNSTGNLGIFIADEETLKNSPMLSYRAIFSIIDFAFDELKLETLEATITTDNLRAVRFNESFGFKIIDKDKSLYLLTKESYRRESKKIKRFLK